MAGPYCHECGQRARDILLPVGELTREAATEGLSLDSRLLATVRGLARPGFLTLEFLAGRRVSYVSPVRLYLVASLAFGAAVAFADETFVMSIGEADPDRGRWVRYWLWTVIAMVPVFAGLVRLAVGKGRMFVAHLVFGLHVHAFGYVVAAVVLPLIELDLVAALTVPLLLAAPVVNSAYLFVALRRVYGPGPVWAAFSTVLIGLLYGVVVLVALGISGLIASRFSGSA